MTNTNATATTRLCNTRTPPGHLNPRAQAVMCALRASALGIASLTNRIGDHNSAATTDLCKALRAEGMLQFTGWQWHLTHDGLGWLQTNGMDATDSAKEWIYRAQDLEHAR